MGTPGARPCPACESTRAMALGEKGGHDLRRCGRCRTIYCPTVPGSVQETYAAYYHDANLEVPAVVHARLAQLVSRMARHRVANRWLDVGCGAGTLMDAATRQGWQVQGTEVSPVAVERLRARGLDVLLGDLVELDLAAASCDVISLIEVIEHVAAPRDLLRAVRRLLRPGGVVYLTTPHARGLSARLLGIGWSVIAPPEHLQVFSRAGLLAATSAEGFRARAVRTEGLNPQELLAARRGDSAPVGGRARVDSAYELNAALERRRGGNALRATANAVLRATRLGESLKYEGSTA